jgi:hypothetical protein
MPITAKSKSHSSRVGIVIFVLLIIMLIEELVADRSPGHSKLPVRITYPTEAITMHTVERETIACMGCARLPMARIDVSGTAVRPGKTNV